MKQYFIIILFTHAFSIALYFWIWWYYLYFWTKHYNLLMSKRFCVKMQIVWIITIIINWLCSLYRVSSGIQLCLSLLCSVFYIIYMYILSFYSSHIECSDESKCIHFTQRCDNHTDCADGSDEMNCEGRYNPCQPLQMACDITNTTQPQCIEADQICDGMFNCPNQHDELVRQYIWLPKVQFWYLTT